ncbi:MAG: 2-phosphosulfolactate phosphatase [Bacteroidales bacterium]|nr:2-phosphosulfolactate phosphatase [Bacteroidales bacterium]
MKIEVSLTPALYPYRTLLQSHATVAIDVLRATTAVCAAFQAGCREVVPLDSLETLSQYRQKGYLLAAERNGSKVGDAEYGNSPTEYLRHDLSGVKLAYSTTNGTVTILRAADADLTLCGSFANLVALADRLLSENRDTVLLCSGWKSDFCIEDTLVAGAIIEQLADKAELWGDAAHMALTLWQQAKSDPYGYCEQASHVHRLRRLGAAEDVRFAFQTDTCPVVPVLKNGVLVLV